MLALGIGITLVSLLISKNEQSMATSRCNTDSWKSDQWLVFCVLTWLCFGDCRHVDSMPDGYIANQNGCTCCLPKGLRCFILSKMAYLPHGLTFCAMFVQPYLNNAFYSIRTQTGICTICRWCIIDTLRARTCGQEFVNWRRIWKVTANHVSFEFQGIPCDQRKAGIQIGGIVQS